LKRLCKCGCGVPVKTPDKQGRTRLYLKGHNRISHGNSRVKVSVELRSYYNAKNRCNNPKSRNWADYGGRGIKFLFTGFSQFYTELGPKPKGMTLDRIDNEGDYKPGNVQWETWSQQRKNQRKQSDSTSTTKGIHWKKETNKWVARLITSQKRIHVGVFNTEEEANVALKKAAHA